MDSGNSGSMQSSSGGDEEYESRADTIPTTFFTNPPTHAASFPANFHPPPPPQSSSTSSSSSSAAMFDHLSTLFDPRSSLSNQNPLLNLDMLWSRTMRSDQISPDLPDPPPDSSATAAAAADQNLSSISNFSGVQTFSQPSDATNSFQPTHQSELQNIPNNCGGGANVARSSKKRPRASRRAPTTVLTTDTTNFRAMVQEFTGIPAPPFTAASSSPFTRNAARFDLFGGGGGAARSAAHLDVVPSTQTYLLRPLPQKPPFLSPSQSTFLAGTNLQNPIFDIHNMLQSNPKFIPSSNDQNLKMGLFDEFGLSNLSHDLPPASQTLQSNNNGHNPPPATWVGGGGGGGESNQQGVNLRSGNGNINGKLIRYAAGAAYSTGFLGDKAAENLRARNEGMVEPWICSSD
ncbi:uncharacterized protein LOC111447253 [Cucurbita moschata]|uniref:Uncharacterized protein LOC111447253 n=1 Tax=Cucurbita moschata TaxID=3662 RepID=A0A6J1FVI5_CUCMO|nr:uncharacterized protein LOC111447253 [Cucurbita moschata]XP_022942065.1 uncharacterized protein LOC111447253 [Cucurbita moschata]